MSKPMATHWTTTIPQPSLMPTFPTNRPEPTETAPASFKWGLGAALAASVAAGLCCVAPLLYLVFGISAAALSGLSGLSWLQAPMAAVALLCLGTVFYRLYISKRPLCTQRGTRTRLLIYFWIISLVTVAVLSYPFVLPWLLD